MAVVAIVAPSAVAIAVAILSFRFAVVAARNERRFQSRCDAYQRLLALNEIRYEFAYWSYPSHQHESPDPPSESEVRELDVLLMMHASDAMGLLAHEFRAAIKKVHAESLQLVGIKNATDMGVQADQEKAVLASVAAEVRRSDALEWAESTRNNLRARVRYELHGSRRKMSLRDRLRAHQMNRRAEARLGSQRRRRPPILTERD